MAQIFNVTFDARDPRRLGRFWSAVTGYPVVEERDDLARLSAHGHGVPDLLFMRVDDPTPGKNRLHLDLAAEDVVAEVVRLVDLGASLVDEGSATAPTWRSANGIRWVVLRDPEGNLLCLGDVPG
jgi:catechol 2,3-dioxygenase-like lactoylglutathione lyase family enzyme